jgi:sterol desaturase/sphingolipid hydroxylase (fatty acid hydroxylase superfamily)
LENLFPLRRKRDEPKRFISNFLLFLSALPITRFLTIPLVLFTSHIAETKGLGLFNYLKFNDNLLYSLVYSLVYSLEFLFLDYILYWWHMANHRISFLWRFHQVHHSDCDMDSTTALRFHFGELILSALLRCLLILLVGIKIEIVLIFDLFVTISALFQHSNLKLPLWLETFLSLFIVTPLFHQNHHSYYLEETNSNYSTIFSFWDRIHFSYTKPNKANDIIIGHPALNRSDIVFLKLIKMPFKQIKSWPLNLRKRNSKI